jgi:ribosomal protein L11
MVLKSQILFADYFLNKQREKAKLEAEMKMICTMRQTIPAGESREFAPLASLLGQFYIPIQEFHKEFDRRVTEWTPGVLIPVKVVKKLRATEFNLAFSSPSISFLIDVVRDENYTLTILNCMMLLNLNHLN